MLGNPGSSKSADWIAPAALAAARDLLDGGCWVPRSWFVGKMRGFGHQLPTLGEVLGLAESDLGAFICLPTDSTPEVAPDEALVASGVPKRSAPMLAIRAWHEERRLGEMLKQQKETTGLNTGGWAQRSAAESSGSSSEPQDSKPTLADVGISKKLSSRSQAIAGIPAEHGGQYLLAI